MDARAELRTLPKDLAAKVARHLVMAGRLAEDEPEQSYKHAKAARRLASRVGIVREAAGIAAYHAGEWAEALAELRAARRLGAGDDSYLPVMADCERGLGRPERALDLIKSPEAAKLDPAGRVELRIVESGVRRDMGQYDAAVVTLQIPELRDRRLRPWSMRLFYAYADALAEAGREGEAADWFARAAAADRDGDTDAAERYAEIEGLHILDTEEEEGVGAEVTEEASAPEEDVVDDTVAEGTNLDDGEEAEGAREGEAPANPAVPEAPGEPEAQAGPGGSEVPGEAEAQADPDGPELPEDAEARADRGEPRASESEAPGAGSEAGASGEPGAATDIAFKPAEPEVLEAPDENAPDAPAVFLEPRSADGEERPAGD
ncbi:TPR repeat-containing protein [Mycobacterium tuberculosis]|nr:TPR repeat-containing protein [Mycobacterium tuberculosis]